MDKLFEIFNGKFEAQLCETFEVHNELNPKLWKDNELKPEVKEHVLKIVDYFKKMLSDNNVVLSIIDIWIVGSNASFNYTDSSDLDVHIIADTSSIKCVPNLLPSVYSAYQAIFNGKYDVSVNGVPVELYVEDTYSSVKSNGVYSLNTGWIKFPKPIEVAKPDTSFLDKKWGEEYDKVMNAPTLDSVNGLINDIYLSRKRGMLLDGEYGEENQAFKNFRDKGYLSNLKSEKVKLETSDMSLGGKNE